MTNQHSNLADEFIAAFCAPPPGKSPEAIKARLIYFADVLNGLNQSDSLPEAAHKRRMALQSIRRLVHRHPGIANQLIQDKNEAAA